MIVSKILKHLHHEEIHALSHSGKKIETVEIDWFERDKKILRKVSNSNEEIGIKLDEHAHALNEGDVIFEDDERLVYVSISASDLILIHIKDIKEMGRCCFELGNRHLSLAIEEDKVLCPFDEPTFDYMKHNGFDVEKVHQRFSNYTECKGHSH